MVFFKLALYFIPWIPFVGYIKFKVYRTLTSTLDKQREEIIHQFVNHSSLRQTRMIRSAMGDMGNRAVKCVNFRGGLKEEIDVRIELKKVDDSNLSTFKISELCKTWTSENFGMTLLDCCSNHTFQHFDLKS